jgi:hypothetical protein
VSEVASLKVRHRSQTHAAAPVILDEDPARDDLAFAKKLAMDNPDLSAELEVLQKEIWDRRGSLMVLSARRLIPLTFMGLLVILAAGSGGTARSALQDWSVSAGPERARWSRRRSLVRGSIFPARCKSETLFNDRKEQSS